MKVLVAEDHEASRLHLENILQSMGHSAEGTGHSVEACEKAKGSEFDLVLLDINLPGHTGFEAAEIILSSAKAPNSEKPPKIIFVSSNVTPGSVEEGRLAGGSGYIGKPVKEEKLQAAIDKPFDGQVPSSPQTVASAKSENEEAAIDFEQFNAAIDPEMPEALEAYNEFKSDSRSELPALLEIAQGGDAPALQQAAHKLVGSFALLGFNQLATDLRQIEQDADAGSISLDQAGLDNLLSQFEAALTAVDQKLS